MKKLDDNTVDSIDDLPDNMILLVAENSTPTMTLKELNEEIVDKMRTKDGVTADK